MASSLLRVALHRVVSHRSVHLTKVRPSMVVGFGGPVQLAENRDPNVNPIFHESLTNPIPDKPRTLKYTGDLATLKEMEVGDWKKLSVEEQMDLYNSYFGTSIADMCRDQDGWKSVLGAGMIFISFGLLLHLFIHLYINPPYVWTTLDEDWVKASIKRQIQSHAGDITGYSSKWDYANNRWK
uniref:cytochrome c oxidase subunit 4 isoform 1, mitochondrial-like n=1 Tax=Ciona intestinalis TaxID=7719 RepID=UPI000180CD0D|nr:cytochrome c oxidase subunit 4 isoform 1, mitochondrial-like [Ciona intestinalis]|eukprot:XP_026690445.1 cytochrome c oxidase subunit 4 isoform 1, mitochondrial-like [Ciona intestinalis]